jgi:hypothetical protein
MLVGSFDSAGAALTVVITATIDRRRSVEVLLERWHVFVVLGPLGSETLRPRTSPLGDLGTQALLPHLLLIDCAQVGMISQTFDIIAQIRRTDIDRPGFFTLSLP